MDEAFVEDLDALLDEIDEILEEDSQEFVEKLYSTGRAVGVLDLDDYGTSNFFQILKRRHPELLATLNSPDAAANTHAMESSFRSYEGTTVLAVVYNAGVVMAGDRQATEGYQVGERRIQKVYPVDRHSAIAVAGAAGPCIEMAKLFQVEVEFYEKTEGMSLSLEGQANFLSHLVRSNLELAMQGLIVLPLFAGYDLKRQRGRIFKYDAVGGRYEEDDYYAIGSGGKDARTTLKKTVHARDYPSRRA